VIEPVIVFITASQLHDNRFNHSGFDPTPGIGTSEDILGSKREILGIKALFRNKYVTDDEMGSQHIDVLGPMPTSPNARDRDFRGYTWIKEFPRFFPAFPTTSGHRA
jgi:hypothetical protein